jgi:hypothetical protein
MSLDIRCRSTSGGSGGRGCFRAPSAAGDRLPAIARWPSPQRVASPRCRPCIKTGTSEAGRRPPGSCSPIREVHRRADADQVWADPDSPGAAAPGQTRGRP